jgi:hypothetical protein
MNIESTNNHIDTTMNLIYNLVADHVANNTVTLTEPEQKALRSELARIAKTAILDNQNMINTLMNNSYQDVK